MKIRTRRKLGEVIEKIKLLEKKKKGVDNLIFKLREAVVDYFERNNSISYKDEEGNLWRRQQSSHTVWYDDRLTTLLNSKRIMPETVFKTKVILERDDSAIKELLIQGKITTEELQDCYDIEYTKAYVRKFPPRSGG